MSESKSPSDSDEQSPTNGPIYTSSISSTSPEIDTPVITAPDLTQSGQFVAKRTTHVAMSSGPLPPPEVMRLFGEVDASLPDRIMRMAEEESNHRRENERVLLKSQIEHARETRQATRRGQWMGFDVAILFLAGTVVVTLYDHDVVGGTLGSATLVSLVVVFVTGKAMTPRRNEPGEGSTAEELSG